MTAVSLAACSSAAFASSTIQLSSLSQVEAALARGASVAATVDLTVCAPAAGTTSPGTTRGGLRIGAYRIVQDGTLSFADEHATVDRTGQPIWQFIRYQVKPDQTIAFTMDMFSLPSYTRIGSQIGYTCAVNQGVSFFTEHR
ncbi:hypothetical protein FNF07_13565 [Trinickia caryophylli]|nr:hypothetical protein C0Z17_05905 [Trinickia caryophylli]TRX20327.1 hypothetical protein FNF07_13565 [Trinickia caryophylli]